MININLHLDMPALDPLILDLQDKFLSQDRLDYAYAVITQRLLRSGFNNKYKIKLISPYPLRISSYGFDFYVDKTCGNSIYLLTFSANGTKFIIPPLTMTWHEYVAAIFQGRKLNLMNLAPWAQAKFINVRNEG